MRKKKRNSSSAREIAVEEKIFWVVSWEEMGNKIARTTQVSATEYYLHDLPSSYNLVLIEVLGRGRFFKSILCKHDEGLVLVKVYFKRGEPLDLKVLLW